MNIMMVEKGVLRNREKLDFPANLIFAVDKTGLSSKRMPSRLFQGIITVPLKISLTGF